MRRAGLEARLGVVGCEDSRFALPGDGKAFPEVMLGLSLEHQGPPGQKGRMAVPEEKHTWQEADR